MELQAGGLVVWDVDGTLIPADLRWLRRAISRTYRLDEAAVVFPGQKVHGYTDESIVVDTALASGVSPADAENGIAEFPAILAAVMESGRDELRQDQPPFPGALATIEELHRRGFVQTVLTGNLRSAAEVKLDTAGLSEHLDLDVGGYGSDDRDRFRLPAVIGRRFTEKYGVPLEPRRTVVIGDAPNDIACARHAGFWAIVVTHRATRDELEPYDPDALVDRLAPETIASLIDSFVNGDHMPPTS
ncbi:HAD family hydrolase [Actinoplanes sp. HUAS TT8]|uniref:HAD family hydrolase n=1 Tax=Actinoplanes sp. HUAS TT8 TaxID=3447453 RepID=UPI003F51B0FA